MWSTIFAIAGAGSSILNGYNNGKNARKIARIQKETAEIQFEYNKKQVKEAAETNIRGALRQYVGAREELYDKKEKARIGLSFSSQMKGTEKEDNSYVIDSKNKLNSEFEENLRTLLDNQKNDLYNIEKQGASQMYQVQGDYNNAISNINNTQIKAQQEADKMVTDGFMKLAKLGMEAWNSREPRNSTKQETPTRFEQSYHWSWGQKAYNPKTGNVFSGFRFNKGGF